MEGCLGVLVSVFVVILRGFCEEDRVAALARVLAMILAVVAASVVSAAGECRCKFRVLR